jgi:protein AIR1/2
VIPHQPDMPREPSAFSEYNIRSGPFFDPTAESSSKKRSRSPKKPRDWEAHSRSLPLEVGKQGRKKEQARMEKIANEQIEEDDWFENQRNVRNRGMQPPSLGPKGKRKVELSIVGAAKRFGDGGQQNAQMQTSAPGLLARLGDRLEPRRSYSNDHGKNELDRRRRDHHSNRRDNRGSRDRYHSRDGPRYNGGYS